MQVGIQPFTISELDEPLPRKLRRIARAGYEGVELGPGENTDAVHEALDETGLSVSSIGTGVEGLEDDLEAHVEAAEAFGTDDVVVMWIGPDGWADEDAVEETAATLEEHAERLADRGLQLHYHNHAHEFTDLGDTTGFEAAVDATDEVMFELDLGWVGTGGEDPIALLEELADRVSLVHFKDMHFEEGEFATFGEGDLDLEAGVAAAEDAGADWGIVENDEPVSPIAELGHASTVFDEYTGHYCR